MRSPSYDKLGDAPPEDSGEEYSAKAPWSCLFSFTLRKHVPYLALAIASSIATGAITPIQAFLYGKVFSYFTLYASQAITTDTFLQEVDKYIIYLILLGSAGWLANSGFFALWTGFGSLQVGVARSKLFGGMLCRDLEWFDMRKHGVGALLTRLNMYVEEFQTATSIPLGLTFAHLSSTVLSLGLSFYFSWDLTLVTIASVPIAAIAVAFFSRKVQPNIDAQADRLGEAAKHVFNAFSSIECVKCFNGQDFEFRRYFALLKQAARFYNRQIYWNSVQGSFIRLTTLGMFVQGFWYGSHLVSSGKMSGDSVLTTFWAVMMATQDFMQIMPLVILLEKGRMAGAKLRAVITTFDDSTAPRPARPTSMQEVCRGEVRLSNVSFSYPARPDQVVLNNVSMEFPTGCLTFVIGKSGSGKSTIGQLLTKFYDPEEGEITLDGLTYRTINLGWLRRNVLLVEQTSILFEDTIAQNIAYGRSQVDSFQLVSEERIRHAAHFAALENMVVDMPKGYNTVVGAKGNSLSGGQRQRVALARAWIRDPQVIILDESTSALDYINRSLIMDAIRKWRRGKTTIIITHDISQILPEDFVYILKDGRVVQEGYRKVIAAIPQSPFQAFVDCMVEPEEPETPMDLNKPLPPHPRSSTRPLCILSPIADSVVPGTECPSTPENGVKDPLEYYLSHSRPGREASAVPSIFSNHIGTSSQRASMRVPSVVSPVYRVMPQITQYEQESPTHNLTNESSRILPSTMENTGLVQSPLKSSRRPVRESRPLSGISEVPSIRSGMRRSNPPPPLVMQNIDVFEMTEMPKASQNVSEETTTLSEEEVSEKGQVESMSLSPILKTIWPSTGPGTRVLLVVALFWLVVYAISTPIFSFVFAKLLSTFYLPRNREHMAMVYSLSILGIACTDAIASFIYNSQLAVIGQLWVNGIRVEGFRRILEQPREFFNQEGNEVSRMADVLDSRAEVMQTILSRFVPAVVLAILMMSVAIIWSLVASWKLTLVGFAAAPVLYLFSTAFERVERKMTVSVQDKTEVVSGIFSETFTSIKTVKSLTLERHFLDKFTAKNRQLMKLSLKRSMLSGIFYGLTESSIMYLTALLFHWGALQASQGTSVTNIVTVFTELLFGFAAVSSILSYVPQLSASRDAASRLLRLARLSETCHEHQGNTRVSTVGEIEFNDLNFHYPSRPDQRILKELSLAIPAGSCVSLVGSSGSGKSTIASLLLNLYPPDNAPSFSRCPPVTLNGRDMKRIHTPSLRNLITIVSQTPFLFPASIEENITYGLKRSSPYNNMVSVRAAATAAGVDDFITSLPQGYSTIVGDGGMGVSGGQAQRISIARALIRHPNVLILDEATSALDVESAAIVRESVRSLINESRKKRESAAWQSSSASSRSGGRGPDGLTVIIITHAREMMNMADKIIMLDRGRLVEQGGYEGLLKKRGPFYRLLSGAEWKDESETVRRRSTMLMNNVKGVHASP